jgi:hypothetical protein
MQQVTGHHRFDGKREKGTAMRIRPGRTRSLIGGIAALMVMIVGLVMMGQFGGAQGFLAPFKMIWVVISLAGAGVAFYNAFSRKGVPLYEIDTDKGDADGYCPQCSKPIRQDDRFCRHCGAALAR